MKNVALVSHTSNLGGAERMLVNLALLLKKTENYNPILFIPNNGFSLLEELCISENIEIKKLNYSEEYIFVKKENFRDKISNSIEYIENLKKYFFVFDVKLCISNSTSLISPILASNELNIPVISWVHGILSSYSIPVEYDPELRYLMEKFLISLSDKVLCCSNWTKSYYLKEKSDNKIETLYNWTQIPEERKRKESNVFICLNSFEEHKGILTLLKAVKIVARKNRKFILELYGNGNLEITQKMKKYIKENNLEKNVKIYKKVKKTEEIYHNSFCLIQPSFVESFGMTIIEAMAHSKPVIASKSGGPEEIIINNETGYLIDRNDEKAMAKKMLFLLENKAEAKKMGENGLKRFKDNFSEEKAFPIVVEILDSLILNREKKQYKKEEHKFLLDIFYKIGTPSLIEKEKRNLNSKITKEIKENEIALSKPIKSRKYFFVSSESSFSKIGFVFSSKTKTVDGKIKLRIKEKGIVIREVSKKINQLEMEHWNFFKFKKIKETLNKKIEIELEVIDSDSIIGVYEFRKKRKFRYKVLGKMGFTINGYDSVVYDIGK